MSPSRSLPPVKNFRARPAFLMQGQIAEFSHRIRDARKETTAAYSDARGRDANHSL